MVLSTYSTTTVPLSTSTPATTHTAVGCQECTDYLTGNCRQYLSCSGVCMLRLRLDGKLSSSCERVSSIVIFIYFNFGTVLSVVLKCHHLASIPKYLISGKLVFILNMNTNFITQSTIRNTKQDREWTEVYSKLIGGENHIRFWGKLSQQYVLLRVLTMERNRVSRGTKLYVKGKNFCQHMYAWRQKGKDLTWSFDKSPNTNVKFNNKNATTQKHIKTSGHHFPTFETTPFWLRITNKGSIPAYIYTAYGPYC